MRLQTLLTSAAVSLAFVPAITMAQATPTNVPLENIVAVVGDSVITRFELREQVLSRLQSRAVSEPKTLADTTALESDALNDMIDELLLLQAAKDLKVEVADADITPMVDRQIRQTRSQFANETEYRDALSKASLGTPEDYRRYLMDQMRRQAYHERVLQKLQQDGKIIPLNVTDAQVAAEFERAKPFLGPKPATVTWKNIVIAPSPTAAAKDVARIKAESLLVEIKAGGDFERIAKRETMELSTKDRGGDLGWIRRADMLPEFDRWLFGGPYQAALQPGQVSQVFATPYGYHIVKVERIQVGEVKARQILIIPKIDSTDVARTAKLADSVATALKDGAPFDTLAKRYHDYAGKEETSLLTPWVRDSLPQSYQQAFEGKKPGDIVTFQIAGAGEHPEIPKFVVAQLVTVDEAGERTLEEMKAVVRADLAQRGGVRRYVDGLRKKVYVSVRLASADAKRDKPKD